MVVVKDKHSNILKVNDKIRFLRTMGNEKNPFYKGDVATLSNLQGVAMALGICQTSKKIVKSLALSKIDCSNVELVK